MTLVFKPITTIQKEVVIQVPGDFGKTTKADIDVEYKRLPFTEAVDLIKSVKDKTADEEACIRENVVNIKGIKNEQGKDVEFSSELLTGLIEEAYIRGPLLAGFLEVNYSLDKLRQKNS